MQPAAAGIFGDILNVIVWPIVMLETIPQFNYIMIGLKIVALMFMIGWVRNRLGGGLIATVVLLVIGYLVLFQYWYIFGPLTIVYLAAMYGAIGMIVTFIFAKSHLFPDLGGEAPQMRPPG